jgi:hypothetical protein
MVTTGGDAGATAAQVWANIEPGTAGALVLGVEVANGNSDSQDYAMQAVERIHRIMYRNGHIKQQVAVRFAGSTTALDLFSRMFGRSAELAFALAFAAAVRELQGSSFPPCAATGIITEDGTIAKVLGVSDKLLAALDILPKEGGFIFPRDNDNVSDIPSDIRLQASSRNIELIPVANLREVLPKLGMSISHTWLTEEEREFWDDVKKEAERRTRGEQALRLSGHRLKIAYDLYKTHLSDWTTIDTFTIEYVRQSHRQQSWHRAGSALAIGTIILAGVAFGLQEGRRTAADEAGYPDFTIAKYAGAPSDKKEHIIEQASTALEQEFYKVANAPAQKFSGKDFSTVTYLINFLLSIDPRNGLAYYYAGEIKRWVNKEDRNSIDYQRSHDDFYHYLDTESHIYPLWPKDRPQDKCAPKPHGYCPERTAWILFSMALDFERWGKFQEALSSLCKSLAIRPAGFLQYGGTEQLLDRLEHRIVGGSCMER